MKEQATPPPAPAPAANWEYKTEGDKMRGLLTDIAIATSRNSIELDSPYDGGSSLQIELLKGPKVGNSANIKIMKGQFSCGSDGCSVAAKFDDKPIENIAARPDANDDATRIRIVNASVLLQKLKAAHHVTLEVPLYDGVDKKGQFEFDVDGLKWEPFTK